MYVKSYIKWFGDTTIEDIPLVGGKNASLDEMLRELGGRGVKVPDGFSVSAAYGLGENVVKGVATPDEYCVFKPTLKTGFRPILRKNLGSKEVRMIYHDDAELRVGNVPVSAGDRAPFALTDDEVLQLARWACVVEEHYSTKRGRPSPMDLEWAKDGETGELFIVEARPERLSGFRPVPGRAGHRQHFPQS